MKDSLTSVIFWLFVFWFTYNWVWCRVATAKIFWILHRVNQQWFTKRQRTTIFDLHSVSIWMTCLSLDCTDNCICSLSTTLWTLLIPLGWQSLLCSSVWQEHAHTLHQTVGLSTLTPTSGHPQHHYSNEDWKANGQEFQKQTESKVEVKLSSPIKSPQRFVWMCVLKSVSETDLNKSATFRNSYLMCCSDGVEVNIQASCVSTLYIQTYTQAKADSHYRSH